MPRAIVVAAGDLDALPAEASTVANTLSSAGWTVRLCVGGDATRAGLLAAAGEGDCALAWFGVHSDADGFALADGVYSPAQLGVWLRNVSARDVVLNSCYSLEHVATIQRAASDVGVACTIAPGGVDSTEAWQWGVYAVRVYVANGGDLQAAVEQASGMGALQYRYIPCGGLQRGRGGRMPPDQIREQLESLLRAVRGDVDNNVPGLGAQLRDLQGTLLVMQNEQRAWRDSVDARLRALEQGKPIAMTRQSIVFTTLVVVLIMAIILVGVLALNRAGA